MKKCVGPCGLEKDELEFSPSQFKRNKSKCKICVAEYKKKYTEENKEKILAQQKEYRSENKEKINKKARKNHEQNKDKINENKRIKYQNNKEKISIRHKKYNDSHKEENSNRNKNYYQKNKKKINTERKLRRQNDPEFAAKNNAQSKEYNHNNRDKINERARNKRKNDPLFILRKNVSNMIWYILKNGKGGESILKYLGSDYPIKLKIRLEETWSWIENLDENGNIWMSWENYGPAQKEKKTWHIDHIKPQTHPDCQYNSMEAPGFLICWDINNLRALEAIQNIKKSNKY